MADPLSLTISGLALLVSGTTAWFTFFRRGKVKMTRPSVIFFGPDGSSHGDPDNKIYLRTLLFSTSKRGRVIESMYISLSRNESRQNFNIWVYGNERLVRGSGLFVGETGVEAAHHFLCPKDGSRFEFLAGRYQFDVYARLLGDSKDTHLICLDLEISDERASELQKPNTGIYFDWGPDSGRYLTHVDQKPEPLKADEIFRTLMSSSNLPSDDE